MKRSLAFLSVVSLAVVAFGCCQDQNALSEYEEQRAAATVEANNIELVQRFIGELNSQNPEIYMEICAPEYRWYFPSINPEPLSREQEMEFVQGVWVAFPDMSWTIDDIFAGHDRVFVQLTARGTHNGEWMGVAATGRSIEASLVLAFRVEDGRIVESKEEGDILGMMQQLGMELTPAADEN